VERTDSEEHSESAYPVSLYTGTYDEEAELQARLWNQFVGKLRTGFGDIVATDSEAVSIVPTVSALSIVSAHASEPAAIASLVVLVKSRDIASERLPDHVRLSTVNE